MDPDVKKTRKKYKRREDDRTGYLGGILAIIFIIGIFLGIRYFSTQDADVKGVRSNSENEELEKEAERAKENVKGNIDKRLDKIKEDIDNLNAVDVTTQSPQIKKIIEDLQSLQDLPKDGAKNVCEQICRGI